VKERRRPVVNTGGILFLHPSSSILHPSEIVMRFADLLRMACGALVRHQARTALTTAGVVVSTFVLVASIATGYGVQATLTKQYQKWGELREIYVRPRYGDADVEAALPPGALPIRGRMSEERRERLRQEVLRRAKAIARAKPRVPLTPDRVRDLAALDHVVSATPAYQLTLRATLNDRRADALVMPAREETDVRDRLLVGDLPAAQDRHGVAVNELLLYQLGVAADDDLEAAVGRPLRLESFPPRRAANPLLLLAAVGADVRGVAPSQERLLARVLKQLPAALEGTDLTDMEKEQLRALLAPPVRRWWQHRPKAPPPAYQGDFVIRGVFRVLGDEPQGPPRLGGGRTNADVLLAPHAAESVYLHHPSRAGIDGFDLVVVEVDRVENVLPVLGQIRDELGLQADAFLERVESERFIYFLVFAAMVVVAIVALLVAALGITNTLLMAVLERTREIGILKSVGARDGHIVGMFLAEGAAVGLTGGLLGLLLGWAVSFPADAWVRSFVSSRTKIHLDGSVFEYPLWLLLGAPAFACLVTTLAAVFPALRAARVDPVAALRHE
jgi:putative ABC transport system permease protein